MLHMKNIEEVRTKISYRSTMQACYTGYVCHAIINHLLPLLFIIFQTKYEISFEMLGRLILVNFGTQLVVDVITVKIVDKVGYRKLMVAAHFFASFGLVLLALLPNVMPNPYMGITCAVVVYALGGGLIEVLVSPIIDSIPSDNKAGSMSFLHSFYCWGQTAVVLFTTLGLVVVGRENWMWLTLLWAIIPFVNMFRFIKVPLMPTHAEGGHSSLRQLFSKEMFILALIMMLCAGSAEHIVSEWSSLFAEKGLGVSKVMGDILGPCLFAVLMGMGRVLYAVFGKKIKVEHGLVVTVLLCAACYFTIALSPIPIISLIACGICGFSVSLMWPGVISLTSAAFPKGGATMFGVLAIFGDLGCSVGPWLSGVISDFGKNMASSNVNPEAVGLKLGLGFGTIFPIVLLICLAIYMRKKKVVKVSGY